MLFMLDLLSLMDTFKDNIVAMIIEVVSTKPNKNDHSFYYLNNLSKNT